MGYYHMTPNRSNVKANRKDSRYIEIFELLRDCEFTVGESRWVAEDALNYMEMHPDCSIQDAISAVFKQW